MKEMNVKEKRIPIKNCSIDKFIKYIEKKDVVIFGTGSWLLHMKSDALFSVFQKAKYLIDNDLSTKEKVLNGVEKKVYHPDALKEETNCVVLFTSPVYMSDMYEQICGMNLQGNVECFALPFISIADQEIEKKELLCDKKTNADKIPKIIHSFWFSGDEKPYEYQRCINTWKEKCPDYDIIEWNQANYDCNKNPFLKKAIEVKAWAFASDYARLDVVNTYGGFYFDMDVEILKNFDELRKYSAVFSFSNIFAINLATFGSEKNNPLLKEILSIYDDIDVPTEKKDFSKFFQPSLVREKFDDLGIRYNGSMQKINDMIFLPRVYFFPMDTVMFSKDAITDESYAIHYDNFGWCDGEDKRKKKADKNKMLWNLVEKF